MPSAFHHPTRRDVFRAGGAGLFGLSMPDFFTARARAAGTKGPPAKQMILLWMAGGPPHQDMFDMKPDTPPPFGSELKQGKTKVPGMEFCDLMPRLAQNADKFSILRSVGIGNEKWEHNGGLYWLCGNPRTKATPKYPMFGSVVSRERPPVPGLPTFMALGHYYDTGDAAGDLKNNYLGPRYDPITYNPGDAKSDTGAMLTPPPHLDLSGFQHRADLLKSLDAQMRRLDTAEPVITRLDQSRRSAFDLLRAPKLRDAVDPKKLNPKDVERYGKNEQGTMALHARQLIEAGVPFVFVPWPGWDMHGNITEGCKRALPKVDALLASLVEDLHERGLLESTIVVALGEMGRNKIYKDSAYSGPPGRDHWGTTQFIFVAGGGFKSGMVLGKTDKTSLRVVENYYSPISFGRTLYHLLGIDPDKELYTTGGRPMKIIVDDAPLISEVIA